MPVRRDGVCQAGFPHDHEARAISEREVFVAILKEQLPRALKSVAVDTLPAKPGTSVDLFPPAFGGAQAETQSNKGHRFIDDKVRRDQCLTSLECGIASLTTPTMSRVR